ncbi:MAG: prolipoprotein diacylglyceryl transferase [Candidatus Rhabdochlamydia sp.]
MFGFLYWDPNPAVFHFLLPLIHRPLMWYGVLFALGFIVGYFIFRYCWLRYLLFSLKFSKQDIICWSLFLQKKHKSSYLQALFETFPQKVKRFCQQKQENVPEEIKKEVIQAINHTVSHPIDFPNSSNAEPSLVCFAKKYMSAFQLERVRSFFKVDTYLQPWILPFRKRNTVIIERLTTYLIIGMLIGAKLGDFIFYQNWTVIYQNPQAIFAFWEAGLASHGAALGILAALWLFCRRYKLITLQLVDLVVIPTPLVGSFIRLGNFVNQEILGVPTDLPWGVVFLHPVGSAAIVARHPVQLYEALGYALLTVYLFFLWKKEPSLTHRGRITGWFFISVFSVRFILEFFKEEQSAYLIYLPLKMGQILSIPFILLGTWFLYRSYKKAFRRA